MHVEVKRKVKGRMDERRGSDVDTTAYIPSCFGAELRCSFGIINLSIIKRYYYSHNNKILYT